MGVLDAQRTPVILPAGSDTGLVNAGTVTDPVTTDSSSPGCTE